MHPLQTAMIIGITSSVLVSALLLVVRKMPSKLGIEWWLATSLLMAISYLLPLVFFEQKQTVASEIIFYLLHLIAVFTLTVGTLLFIDGEPNKSQYCLLFAVTAGVVCALNLSKQQFMADLVFVIYNSLNLFFLSFKLLRLKEKNRAIKFTGLLCLLTGAHWLDYPILKNIEWLAPIGFLVAMVLGMFLGLSLAILALLQFEKQTKESEQKAIFAATHDPLTGLYNRSYLDKLFNMYAKEATAEKRTFAILYLDLDGFKAVNDTYGHKAGDFLLQVIAKRLTNLLHDRGNAIRIGGDEIVVLSKLRTGNNNDHVYGLARKMLDTMEQPIINGKQTYNISASIGVCCYPLHGESLEQLLEKTDSLMYAAKKGGRRQIKFADFTRKVKAPKLLAPA